MPVVGHWMINNTHLFLCSGVLRSPRTCLHSILCVLEIGVGSKSGPACLYDTPILAELCYHLIYMLCANKDTSDPTMRYLRTTHDFFYRHLQHLPFSQVESKYFWNQWTVQIVIHCLSLDENWSFHFICLTDTATLGICNLKELFQGWNPLDPPHALALHRRCGKIDTIHLWGPGSGRTRSLYDKEGDSLWPPLV
jgi:hypothetical protein